MVELKEKTVEELRKMASRKKIEGRSKMNKAQLVSALKKCTTTKKRKMKGGRLSDDQLNMLATRNYQQNPLYFYFYARNPRTRDLINVDMHQGFIQNADISRDRFGRPTQLQLRILSPAGTVFNHFILPAYINNYFLMRQNDRDYLGRVDDLNLDRDINPIPLETLPIPELPTQGQV